MTWKKLIKARGPLDPEWLQQFAHIEDVLNDVLKLSLQSNLKNELQIALEYLDNVKAEMEELLDLHNEESDFDKRSDFNKD